MLYQLAVIKGSISKAMNKSLSLLKGASKLKLSQQYAKTQRTL